VNDDCNERFRQGEKSASPVQGYVDEVESAPKGCAPKKSMKLSVEGLQLKIHRMLGRSYQPGRHTAILALSYSLENKNRVTSSREARCRKPQLDQAAPTGII
jgi:hypothetical protein